MAGKADIVNGIVDRPTESRLPVYDGWGVPVEGEEDWGFPPLPDAGDAS